MKTLMIASLCAVLAVTHPHLIRTAALPVAVEVSSPLTRGATVVDERGFGHRDDWNVIDVGMEIDAPAALEVLVAAILAY